MEIESLTHGQLAHLERLMQRHPQLEGLEALLLVSLEDDAQAGRKGLDSGRLSRRFDVAHALVRRSAASLEARGLIEITERRGAGPGVWLALVDKRAVAGV
ncbi:hypothetical protein [Kushneria konosiri]|uniref:HTH marR-type domain-containing protein n=1 Tax=Kushneria konosiri TaxID=698828 RepID=A0A2Z2H6P3_9GAMM|nr:hypothetical protein [Kushneria konosiri]ARS53055.1 hypothetical protein B9G99_09285 [Kushneria konosiri]